MLYIRTDMNTTIATGHVMRCLSIADAARRLGEETTFLLADEWAVELLTKRGYGYHVLHTNWQNMEEELPLLEQLIGEQNIKSMLIDSYQVTPAYLEGLSHLVKTLYLDDVNAFPYPVHGILCYGVYAEQLDYPASCRKLNVPWETQLYLGPQYAPLRREFVNKGKKEIPKQAERILLLSGGSDPYHILEGLLERLEEEDYRQITVICGRFYEKYEELQNRYRGQDRIRLLQAVDNIQDYMEDADLVVSAGGSTLYELSALGTPAISYALADNQMGNVHGFQQLGLIEYAGDVRTEPVAARIAEMLRRYRGDRELRKTRSEAMQRLIDGRGAERIVEAWKSLEGNSRNSRIRI